MAAILGVGPEIARSVKQHFSVLENRLLAQRLEEAGLQLSLDHEVPGTTGLLDGKTFVLTGSLPCLSRKEASELISLHGGKVVSSVSLRTDFVIVGTGPGSKLKKAQELGVETIDEEDLREMIRS